jgi:DNA-binding response OmpR family regulator
VTESLIGALEALKLARRVLDDGDSRGLAALQRVARATRDVAGRTGDETLADLAEAVEDTGTDPDGSVARLLHALRVRLFSPVHRDGGILVITSNAEARKDWVALVSDLAPRLLEADTPARAAQLLQREAVCAIVLELDSRPDEGLALVSRVRNDPTLAGVPVVVLARDASPLLRAEARALGATEWLDLPVPDPHLLDCLSTLTGHQSSMHLEMLTDPRTGLQMSAALKAAIRALRHDAEVTQQAYCMVLCRPTDGDIRAAARRLEAHLGSTPLYGWEADILVLLPATGAQQATKLLSGVEGIAIGGVEVIGMAFEQAITSARRMLDLAEQAGAGPVITSVASTAPPRHRVLVVEDDRTVGEIVVRALNRTGLTTVLRENGLQALEAAEALRFDLIITDVVMPFMDGLTLVRKLREIPRYKRTPIIVLTSLDSERHIIEGFGTGADSYVTKPFNPRILQARVNSLLERHQG